MHDFQDSIFNEGNAHHLFLELDLVPLTGPIPGKQLLANQTPRVYTTFAMSSRFLDAIDHRLTPEGFQPFQSIQGPNNKQAPSTPSDLFIWVQSNQRDEVFHTGLRWVETLKDFCVNLREEHGFLFRDSRDLTGFVDGSANPKDNKRMETAIIPSGAHAGGSFVFCQRWKHDLRKFNELEVKDQEKVIGRTKKDSVEFKGDDQPINSHVSRTDIKADGNPLKIYRRSTPTGGVRDPGLFFLAFSSEMNRFQHLLNSMFGLTQDGIQDKLLEYSTPLTGNLYFAPSQTVLGRLFR